MSLTLAQTNEIVASTMEKYETELINQTIMATPTWEWFLRSPRRKTLSGGYRIRLPVIRQNSDNFMWFGMGDTFNPQRQEILGWSYATIKQGAGDVTLEYLELLQNSGEGQFVSLLEAKIGEVEQTVKQNLNTVVWGDGTEHGGKSPVGLTGHISTSPATGTYLGWSRATEYWTRPWFWNNVNYGPHPKDQDPSGGTSLQPVGAMINLTSHYPTIWTNLTSLWNGCVTQGDDVNGIFFITDLATHEWYEQIPARCPGFEIPSYEGTFNSGITNITYKKRPIMWDTVENGAPSGELRLVNSNYMVMYVDSSNFFKWTDWRSPYDALVQAKFLLVRFALVDLMPSKHGLLTGITAPATP